MARRVAGGVLTSPFIEVVGAEIAVNGALTEHVADGHEQGVSDRHLAAFLVPAPAQTPVMAQ